MSAVLYPAEAPIDHLRPSLFELLAQEQLRDLLHPVVRYVLSYLAQHYPRYFLRVLNRHEEFFALLLLVVERHHLKKHNASLSEHFYQLKLTPDSSLPTPRLNAVSPRPYIGLSRKQRWGMLVFLVGLPYVRARLQDYYERLGGGPDREELNEELVVPRTLAQRTFKAVYPYANLALDSVLLGCDIAYMFEKTRYYRPWLAWMGLRVVRDDGEAEGILGGANGGGSRSLLSRLPPLLPPLLLLLKLSQWWYSPSSPRHIAVPSSITDIAKTHASILPPRPLPILPNIRLFPRTDASDADDEQDEDAETPEEGKEGMDDAKQQRAAKRYAVSRETYGLCPLCGDKWKNPAVLPTGWVVCWRCGWDALEGEGEEEEADNNPEQAEQEGESKPDEEDTEAEPKEGTGGASHDETSRSGPVKRRKGYCPITGAPIGRGQLRRVLV